MAAGTSSGKVRGTAAGNVDGRAIAITVFSTVKPWGKVWLPVLFALPRVAPNVLTELRRLSFIHFARWTLVRRIPYNGPPQKEVKLHHPHLFFESNFNGGWEEYIDAFSYVLTRGMRLFWGSSYGFPGSLPTVPFKKYIHDNEIEASHYYAAYPEASASMVLDALELEPRVTALVARARTAAPEEFAAEWRRFLTEAQRWL